MENNDGCVIGFIWIASIGVSVGSGIAAWNMIEPKSFFGAIVFIALWAILFKVIYSIIGGIVMLIFDR